MKDHNLTPEEKEAKKVRRRKRYSENPEKYREKKRKYHSDHIEESKEYMKRYKEEHPHKKRIWRDEHPDYTERQRERRAQNPEEYRARMKKYQAEDVNSNGISKGYIRTQSGRILLRTHSKIKGYQIHHCFTYDDPNKFIYIPKRLHKQIHRLLKDNNIPSDSDHWMAIRDLVNSCEEYTYIRC